MSLVICDKIVRKKACNFDDVSLGKYFQFQCENRTMDMPITSSVTTKLTVSLISVMAIP